VARAFERGMISVMRSGLLGAAIVIAACACDREQRPPAHVDPATLITPDATGITRSSGADSPILATGKELYDLPCSDDLLKRVTDAYQVQLTYPDHYANYWLFYGNIPREDVESCLGKVLEPQLEHDGDMLVGAVQDKKGYAAWRGDVIVAGPKSLVAAALVQHDDALAQIWRDRIAALPRAKYAMWEQHGLLTPFLGVPTKNFTLASNITGPHSFEVRFMADCADETAAARATQQLATGQVPPGVDPPPAIKAGLKRAKVTTAGAHIEITIDQATFPDLDVATLQSWMMDVWQRAK
jgi:hypothetical protein